MYLVSPFTLILFLVAPVSWDMLLIPSILPYFLELITPFTCSCSWLAPSILPYFLELITPFTCSCSWLIPSILPYFLELITPFTCSCSWLAPSILPYFLELMTRAGLVITDRWSNAFWERFYEGFIKIQQEIYWQNN